MPPPVKPTSSLAVQTIALLAATLWAAPLTLAASPEPGAPEVPPITIEADRMQYDDRQRVNVFTGNVVLTRGPIEIRATRLQLRQDADGGQFATASGSPATFRQRDASTGELIEGSGQELRYDDRKQELQILDGASLRKSVGGRVSDEVHGARIVYDSGSDFFTVESGESGATGENPRGRVRVVIQPQSARAPSKGAAELRPAGSIATVPARSR